LLFGVDAAGLWQASRGVLDDRFRRGRPCRSGGRGERAEASEGGGELLGPGPGGGQSQGGGAGVEGETGGDVQQAVAQAFGFGGGEFAGQEQSGSSRGGRARGVRSRATLGCG
jgi:hypothetical protein